MRNNQILRLPQTRTYFDLLSHCVPLYRNTQNLGPRYNQENLMWIWKEFSSILRFFSWQDFFGSLVDLSSDDFRSRVHRTGPVMRTNTDLCVSAEFFFRQWAIFSECKPIKDEFESDFSVKEWLEAHRRVKQPVEYPVMSHRDWQIDIGELSAGDFKIK